MADDGGMVSLLAAVEVASAAPSSPKPPSSLSLPRTNTNHAPPPPPPPLPPPLPQKHSLAPTSPTPHPTVEKRKGARVFSADEKKILEANYARNKFPSRLHMQTLGRAMAKGTEKVRTWYNNRRALDRKLGINVNRNATDDPHSPRAPSDDAPSAPTPPSKQEETVILPSRAVVSTSTPPPTNPSNSADTHKQSNVHFDNTDDSLVNVTPSNVAWASTVSPVTSERHGDGYMSPPAIPPPARLRMSPLRIRSARLVIGATEICGEGLEEPFVDAGLEVKFLFGKKRLVYEWYCGRNYAEAQNTGGPYAKVEINFSSMKTMRFEQGPSRSVLHITFSAEPALFVQTQESMDKYKSRSQQRQYRKVSAKEFPTQLTSSTHRICMKFEEAARVSRIILEDDQELASMLLGKKDQLLPLTAEQRPNSQTQALTPAEPSDNPKTPSIPSIVPLQRLCDISPKPMRLKSVSSEDMQRARNLEGVDAPLSGSRDCSPVAGVKDTDSRQNAQSGNDQPIVRSTTAAGAATNLLTTPGPWQSPTTPFASVSKQRRDEAAMFWMTSSIPPSMTATPFADRISAVDTPRDSTKVRRELNFNKTSTEPATPATPGQKRKVSDMSPDENESSMPLRKKSTPPHLRTPLQALRFGVPDPPFPPQLPPVCSADELREQDRPKLPLPGTPDRMSNLIHRLPR